MVTQGACLASSSSASASDVLSATHQAPLVTPLEPLREVVQALKLAAAGRFDSRSRSQLLSRARKAGAAVLPALIRSLVSYHGLDGGAELPAGRDSQSDLAYYLLRELDLADLRPRLIERLNELLVDRKLSDELKARVLGLLSDLRAPVPEDVILEDPDALLARSVRDLLGDIGTPASLMQALDLIFDQVPAAELETFLVEVVQHGGDASQPLLAGLLCDPRTPRPVAEQLTQWVRPTAPSPRREPALPVARPTRTARPQMRRALRLLAHGALLPAHSELQALHAERQDDPMVCSALGLCLLRLGKAAAACEPLERAALVAPTAAANPWNAAVAAHLAERPASCYRHLQQYLRCTDTREGAAARQQAATALCAEYARLGSQAYPHLSIEELLASEASFEQACADLHDARYAAAVTGFQAVLDRLPAHPASWRNLGFAYLAQRRPRDAARCFSRVLRLEPLPRSEPRPAARERATTSTTARSRESATLRQPPA